MPPPRSKKPRLIDTPSVMHTIASRPDATFDDLGTDELAHILGFLGPFDIMRARLNKKMRNAAKQTIVPMTEFVVDSVGKYNLMVAMSIALPNLQQILLQDLGGRHNYSDGEDPDEGAAEESANFTSLDIDIISNFRKLRILYITVAPLNGRYPVLFDFPLLRKLSIRAQYHLNYITVAPLNGRYPILFDFPLLRKLSIRAQYHLKFDLEMLAGLPMLEELYCYHNPHMGGNLRSLRVLKNTLELVTIGECENVRGNFMDLADFPNLMELDLWGTNNVSGDIRDIGERDFLALDQLILPKGICGGRGFEFQLISDAPDVISTLYSIMKQRPVLLKYWYGMLSLDSPDWYSGGIEDGTAPLNIKFVQAGSRVGYHWFGVGFGKFACEVIWLDPEPDRESNEYETYIEELQKIENEIGMFEGFQQPPTEDEFHLLTSRSRTS
eukprot:CAMPEP_0201710096 /NCGR_PEP_ID=MMETSP0578-20130828/58449_1 /ASSEMBLY_ACC=CAM_ASM_000663 /TAXON_ID=267565 /ORGANISM="Skeletonema grethea, Strain CCMP 1804" /LENGTH=439 /DNA_ID=CAMNT_0048199107 /DNA_START=320 /DNA_END=1640 /DNA_ORIENTATION=+